MTLYFIKKNGSLVPSNSGTKNRLAKIANGTIVRCKLNVTRNPKFHRKVMALLQIGFDNQSEYSDFDDYRRVDGVYRAQVRQDLPGYAWQ